MLLYPKASLRGRARRESFEKRITRPHFHVKPLDDVQLCAWSEFLDFEISQQDEGGRDTIIPSPIPVGGNAVNSAGYKRSRGGSPTVSRGCDVERLFERCLVPCASYWCLWERYALWKVFGLFFEMETIFWAPFELLGGSGSNGVWCYDFMFSLGKGKGGVEGIVFWW